MGKETGNTSNNDEIHSELRNCGETISPNNNNGLDLSRPVQTERQASLCSCASNIYLHDGTIIPNVRWLPVIFGEFCAILAIKGSSSLLSLYCTLHTLLCPLEVSPAFVRSQNVTSRTFNDLWYITLSEATSLRAKLVCLTVSFEVTWRRLFFHSNFCPFSTLSLPRAWLYFPECKKLIANNAVVANGRFKYDCDC